MSTASTETPTDKATLDLLARGYKAIESYKGITAGSRVRNVSHQYPEAYRDGTATVVAVMERSPSSWSLSYGARDIEIVVDPDDKTGGSLRAWTDYGTALVTPLPF